MAFRTTAILHYSNTPVLHFPATPSLHLSRFPSDPRLLHAHGWHSDIFANCADIPQI
jgi:hypothetical protein